MPDQNGRLSAADREKFVKWLQEKGVSHNCPVCAKNSWTIGEHLLSGAVFNGGGLVIGGASYPTAIVVCNNCAYTRHFMAAPIGLLDDTTEPQNG